VAYVSIRKENWIAFKTLTRREIRRFLRIWVQTLIPPAITMSLYFIIFGHLIGGKIGSMAGYSYMEYIIPGLIMMSVITNSYANVVSSFYSSKFQRNIEELLVSPMPNQLILLGFLAGGVTRGILVGLIVLAVSFFFSHLSVNNIWLFCAILFLTSLLFSTAGLINAVFANSFDDINIVPTFILTPLTYLGGVFYSISLLPELGQTLSLLNPIFYMVNAFRYSVLGHADASIALSLGILISLNVILYAWATYLIQKSHGLRN
jgi:ABC-2 type transport system permease protein